MELLVKAHRKEIEPEIMKLLKGRRAEIYLKCDGTKTVTIIANELNMKTPNVSRELTTLKNRGLIKIRDITNEGYIYERTKIDKILGISRKLGKSLNIRE